MLDAQIKIPQQVHPSELQEYDLIGFGSGIYGEKHHKLCLTLLIQYLKLLIRKHSSSQQVQL
ncbi:MAG: hypothetical protein ACFFD7_04740 [Candidatus Thorarchaeota archaeon]